LTNLTTLRVPCCVTQLIENLAERESILFMLYVN
jgi:hypothetical protein